MTIARGIVVGRPVPQPTTDIPELGHPAPGWGGSGGTTWLIPAGAGQVNYAAVEWTGAPFMFAPFFIGEPIVVDAVRTLCTTASASSTMRLALYATNPGGWPDGYPVYDFGTIDTSTTGAKDLSGWWPIAPGRYWVAVWVGGGSQQICCMGPNYAFLGGVPNTVQGDLQQRAPWPRPTTTFHASNPYPLLGGSTPQESGNNGTNIVPYVRLRRAL